MATLTPRKVKNYLKTAVLLFSLILGIFTQLFPHQADQLKNIFPQPSPSPVLGKFDDKGFEQVVISQVIDGDTIKLSDGRTVRYIGIDTPETQHPTVGQECFGKEASQKNKELVEGKTVELEKDVSETDRYGRLLRYVWLNGEMINTRLVQEGYAFARSYPPDIAHQETLKIAEQTASSQKLGLWSSCPQ